MTPNEKDRQKISELLLNLDDFRRWSAANPKIKALPNGAFIRQMTEDEWVEKATSDNKSDSPIHQLSFMTGWVMNDTGAHILQKVSKPTFYQLPKAKSVSDADTPEKPQTADRVPERQDPDTNLPFNSTAFLKFSDAVAKIESNGDYGIIGGYNNHYLGKYQMGKAALKDVGIGYTQADREAYLSNPDMQEDAFEQFTLQNHNFLKNKSQKYRDMMEQEQLSILGYAHNQGAGGALRYLQTGKSQKDGFGTDAQKYVDAVRDALG